MWYETGLSTRDLVSINRYAGNSGTWLLPGGDLVILQPERYLLFKSHNLQPPVNNKFSSNLGGPRYQKAGSAIQFRDLRGYLTSDN